MKKEKKQKFMRDTVYEKNKYIYLMISCIDNDNDNDDDIAPWYPRGSIKTD